MSSQFTLPELGHGPLPAPRRYITSLNAMHHQPGGQRRMAPRKQKEPKVAIPCGNSKCTEQFIPNGQRSTYCCTDCYAAAKRQKDEVHFAAIRAAKAEAGASLSSDEKALEVWERTRPGAKSFAQQTEDYYTFGMTPQQKRNWQAKQAAKLEILKRGMGL